MGANVPDKHLTVTGIKVGAAMDCPAWFGGECWD